MQGNSFNLYRLFCRAKYHTIRHEAKPVATAFKSRQISVATSTILQNCIPTLLKLPFNTLLLVHRGTSFFIYVFSLANKLRKALFPFRSMCYTCDISERQRYIINLLAFRFITFTISEQTFVIAKLSSRIIFSDSM